MGDNALPKFGGLLQIRGRKTVVHIEQIALSQTVQLPPNQQYRDPGLEGVSINSILVLGFSFSAHVSGVVDQQKSEVMPHLERWLPRML
ncbi:MAG: hypothetical protein R2788_24605 [Saprospiraceae bacterium]